MIFIRPLVVAVRSGVETQEKQVDGRVQEDRREDVEVVGTLLPTNDQLSRVSDPSLHKLGEATEFRA